MTKFTVAQAVKPTMAVFTFDFLDPNDGAALEILHTSEKKNPKVLGTIRGVPKGIVSWGDFSEASFPFFLFQSRKIKPLIIIFNIFYMVLAFMGVISIIMAMLPENLLIAIFSQVNNKDTILSVGIGKRVFSLLFGIVYALPAIQLLWLRRRRFPKSLKIEE